MEARLTGVDENEVLLYLGYKGGEVPDGLLSDIAALSEKLIQTAVPRLTYRIFEKQEMLPAAESVLEGNDVKALLKECQRVVFFGATLGAGIDRYLSRLQIQNVGQALIFDACANSAIENLCDNFCEDIANQYGYITDRFSPGYGDLPFDKQYEFAEILSLQKTIGAALTESGLIVPQKSVTAVFGIAKTPQPMHFRGCSHCNLFRTCTLRKEGRTCGKF